MFNGCSAFVILIVYIYIFLMDFLCVSRSGSTVVDMTLIYKTPTAVPDGTVAVETLSNALSSGTISLDVDSSSITSSRFNTRCTFLELNPVTPVIVNNTYLL